MKKVIITIALVAAAATSAFAQIGVSAGYANNSQKTQNSDPSTTNGFYVEGTYSIPVAGAFSIVPGVRYTYLGSSKATNILSAGLSASLVEHYLAIPIMAQYGIDLGAAQLFAFAGPTFSYGLASKTTVKASAGGFSADKPIDNYKDTDYLRPNLFLGGGLGIQLGSFQVKAAYDFGLLNRMKSDKITLKDNQFRVGVAYLF